MGLKIIPSDENKINSKTVIVTGSARGIGRAIALKLASQGALVIAHYGASKDAAAEVTRMIESSGGSAFAIQADLARFDAIDELFREIDTALAQRGIDQLDIVVNNAGITMPGGLDQITEEMFDRAIAVNLKAPPGGWDRAPAQAAKPRRQASE